MAFLRAEKLPDTRVVLVTGASSGLGLATASLLASKGFVVFGTSRHPSRQKPSNFEILKLNLNSDSSVRNCVSSLLQRAGRLDVLVNNAGYALAGAIEETSIAEAKAQFETNFFGAVRLVNSVLPVMRKRRGGQIINVGSIAGLAGSPLEGFYTATKYALEGFTETLRMEVEGFGIKVSIVDAGFFKTNIGNAVKFPEIRVRAYDTLRSRVDAVRKRRRKLALLPPVFAEEILKVVTTKSPKVRYSAGEDTWFPQIESVRPRTASEADVLRFWNLRN